MPFIEMLITFDHDKIVLSVSQAVARQHKPSGLYSITHNEKLSSNKDTSSKKRFTNLPNKPIPNYYIANNKSLTPDQSVHNQFIPTPYHPSSIKFNFGNIQTKLKVSQLGDAYEQEADRVSEQVMRMDRNCAPCDIKKEDEKKTEINRKISESTNLEVTDKTTNEINNIRSSNGCALDAGTKQFMESRFGYDFSNVRIHAGKMADRSADSINALAFTAGNDIVFRKGQYQPATLAGRRLLAHELMHVVQQTVGLSHHTDNRIMRTPVEKVLKFAEKWLAKRWMKTVTKHIAKHARGMAGRAVHGIFKSPKKIKSMLELTVREALEVVAKHPKTEGNVIEEAGIRITKQSTRTPGKVRWLIQKEFKNAIGTEGERILRMILDQSGRIVTAFPADRLIALGLTVGGIELLEERTATAAEHVHQEWSESARREEERENKTDWWDFVPIIGDIWGGELNAGEAEILRERDFNAKVVEDVISEVEHNEKRTLGKNEREQLKDLIRVAIASPLYEEEEESNIEEKNIGQREGVYGNKF